MCRGHRRQDQIRKLEARSRFKRAQFVGIGLPQLLEEFEVSVTERMRNHSALVHHGIAKVAPEQDDPFGAEAIMRPLNNLFACLGISVDVGQPLQSIVDLRVRREDCGNGWDYKTSSKWGKVM